MSTPPSADLFLTVPELAARWKRRPESIYWLRARGEGPVATRIGRELRFRLADVEAWEEGQRRLDQSRRKPA